VSWNLAYANVLRWNCQRKHDGGISLSFTSCPFYPDIINFMEKVVVYSFSPYALSSPSTRYDLQESEDSVSTGWCPSFLKPEDRSFMVDQVLSWNSMLRFFALCRWWWFFRTTRGEPVRRMFFLLVVGVRIGTTGICLVHCRRIRNTGKKVSVCLYRKISNKNIANMYSMSIVRKYGNTRTLQTVF